MRDVLSEPVRLGVLGCADIAVRRLLPAVAATDGVRLAAVASRRAATAEAVTGTFGGQPVEGYDALLRRDDIDAVYVPLPAALHAEWVERALLAGKHTLAEKPLTTDARHTARLVGLARAKGLVLRENFTFVHHPQHARVRRLVEEGAIGRPLAFQAAFTVPPRPPGDIRLRPELGGGARLDVGVYPLRAALLLLGDELGLVGAALHHDETYGVDVGGAALLRRSDGVTAQLTFGMTHMYEAVYQLLGSEGRITVDRAFTTPAGQRPAVTLERAGGVRTPDWEPADQWARAVAAFVRDVTQDAGTPGTGPVRLAELLDEFRPAPAGAARSPQHGQAAEF
ncbi:MULTISPECIES: Gfo/Idh/MocA family protein [unclassified Streptomyces]|uniref:Gfo/Idh/MocA family protein n=1 Tax=unclassified Streptomyces TaxID=2593676 RepID=UPI002E28C40A|nr:Gfo/Idh/MocA family oxidoreductase [Streptomyces sp. NBC_00223]